ncbi:MAG: T9SS type A sorting domain-containing protein, partial [Chitinophagales bacterium]
DQASTLFFDNPTNEALTLRIIDLSGQVIHQQNNIRNNQVVLGQEDFSSGLYLVELTGERTVFKGKIVVQ